MGGLSISETADLLGFSHTTLEFGEMCEKQETSREQQFCGQKKKLLITEVREGSDWSMLTGMLTLSQITTHYNSGMQKSIIEHTTRQTSKWIGYNNRRQTSLKNKSNKYLTKCSLNAFDC